MFVSIGILAFILWNRDDVSTGILFGVTALFAFCAGGLFSLWLKDRYW